MNAIIITEEQYGVLISKIEKIQNLLYNSNPKPEDQVLTNEQFIQFLKISKRTSQFLRDNGKISFSQIGNKIYYKMSDVQKLLDTHYRKAFSKIRNNF